MRKLILLAVIVGSAFSASSKIEYKSLDNKGNNTTIVFAISEDERDASNGLSVDDITFECDGKSYTAKDVDADFGQTTTVTATFKKLKKFANARLIFKVNGKERSIDIQQSLMP